MTRSLRWLLACSSITLPIASIAACNSLTGLDSFEKVDRDSGADANVGPDVVPEAALDVGSDDREEDSKDAAAEPDVILIDATPYDGSANARKWALWHMPEFATGLPDDAGAVLNPASYTELDAGAADADASPDADAAAGNKIIRDNVTGMKWEQNISTTADNLSAAESHCKSLEPAGEWSLPTRIELVSLLNLGVSPTLDSYYFPNTKPYPFWTASPVAGQADSQWGVHFVNGEVLAISITSTPALVRCVKPAGDSSVHYRPFGPADHTIVEEQTELRWQRYVTAASMQRTQALSYCSEQPPDTNQTWRLPTMKELQTLVDDDPHEEYEGGNLVMKAIDREAFPGTPAADFWTLSEVAGADGGMLGYVVNFGTGASRQVPIAGTYARVRCVRYQKLN